MNTAALRKYLSSPTASDPKYIVVLINKLCEACSVIEESNDMLLSCALQFLMEDDGIVTHSYMSTEEALCKILVQRGIFEEVSRGKFRVIAESNAKITGPGEKP